MDKSLIRKRQAIQHLLSSRSPHDAMVSYYALHHPPDRTHLSVHTDVSGRVDGFLALCRTGMDLFRPLLTMRADSQEIAAELIDQAVQPELPVIIAVPLELRPLIEALFAVSGEAVGSIYQLERPDFHPVINVLVTRAPTPSGEPRFVIREQSFDRGARPTGAIVAQAGVNWRSPEFADIYVSTDPRVRGRGLGKSVVSALSNWLLEQNVTPLFTIAKENRASHELSTSLGYQDTGAHQFLCEGVRRQAAFPLRGNMVE
jgi:GNAT superfamily N-acetyltransferase